MLLSAAKWGAAFGAAAYLVLSLGLTALARALFGGGPADLDHPALLTSACLGIIGLLFAFSAAGYFAAREVRAAGAGALAGMLAFAVYAALSALYTPGQAAPAASAGSAPALSPVAQFASAVVALILGAALAGGMGWLGGRPGAQRGIRRRGQPVSPADEAEPR